MQKKTISENENNFHDAKPSEGNRVALHNTHKAENSYMQYLKLNKLRIPRVCEKLDEKT